MNLFNSSQSKQGWKFPNLADGETVEKLKTTLHDYMYPSASCVISPAAHI